MAGICREPGDRGSGEYIYIECGMHVCISMVMYVYVLCMVGLAWFLPPVCTLCACSSKENNIHFSHI